VNFFICNFLKDSNMPGAKASAAATKSGKKAAIAASQEAENLKKKKVAQKKEASESEVSLAVLLLHACEYHSLKLRSICYIYYA
jgi:hypothetical protein